MANISNIRGTESKSLRKKLKSAKDAAMNDLKLQAYELGVNAIIGLDLDYTMFGDTIVGVIISGTANN
ncbi:heavy metal-binding domain-containing protein [Lachnotalea sp. AF33-28]|uniref:heavy metal-binding domain-containing protein n=1 Tax=Lachnotalea sp. AF33-28 TaxID=2292046 RepID=UPI000E4C2FD9|nr:hypothetical protein DWZ56_07225 [Lachnotalea sp. AF33-28]